MIEPIKKAGEELEHDGIRFKLSHGQKSALHQVRAILDEYMSHAEISYQSLEEQGYEGDGLVFTVEIRGFTCEFNVRHINGENQLNTYDAEHALLDAEILYLYLFFKAQNQIEAMHAKLGGAA